MIPGDMTGDTPLYGCAEFSLVLSFVYWVWEDNIYVRSVNSVLGDYRCS